MPLKIRAAMIKATGHINKDGKLILTHPDCFRNALAAHPDKAVELSVEVATNGISHNQRKYFYGVIVDILQAFFISTGIEELTKAQVVDFLKDRFLFREHLCPISNKYVKTYISLGAGEGAMSREEFTEKKEAIQHWAAEKLALEIPDPDPNWRIYKNKQNINH